MAMEPGFDEAMHEAVLSEPEFDYGCDPEDG